MLTKDDFKCGISETRYLELLKDAERQNDRKMVGVLNRLYLVQHKELELVKLRSERDKRMRVFELISEIYLKNPSEGTDRLKEAEKALDMALVRYEASSTQLCEMNSGIRDYKRERKIEILTRLIDLKK